MHIRVMPDYDCAPLWWDEGKAGDVRPEELRLSDDLCADLWAWAAIYDATLVRDDPIKSGFASDADERAFEGQGRRLTERVAAELGVAAKVRFWREG